MPWKNTTKQEQRFDLVRQMQSGETSISELCDHFKIARVTAYKWLRRFRAGKLKALQDQSRRPRQVPRRTSLLWLRRIQRLRNKHKTWGARKLHYRLQTGFGPKGCPAVGTISRWLNRWGLARGHRRSKTGPVVLRPKLRPARHCNDVWTVDFKGCFKTGDGTRVDPLTVRDLYSRYGFCIVLLRDQTVARTQQEFIKIFKQHGLPKRIRSDNGVPFGGGGPTGLTRLSAWWVRLGIKVEFITPARPCENGSHEQFHRVYKLEAAKNPARTRAGQQRRSNQWLRHYNEQRPHEALKMKVPAGLYRKSQRRLPAAIKPWKYPAPWPRCWVKGNGQINFEGRRRFVGEAFIHDYIGLKPVRKGVWRVYFGPLLVGELHGNETGVIRPAQYLRQR
jgi:transposase InsO family protein